ncbi:mycofactocin-coupled SDR family oxidoreductase [Nocardia harenae]|uniref:mycofactocin-coupled SDR family oxidoreductase n=1 Tax=Nocardia harenae TaxID=358707 RepID=UPI00082C7CA9|nr:mycofactocin-coupled SDR family oxidoreductase [Nocardia harenae]
MTSSSDAGVGPRFAGKVALVTGAARGQGRAEAVRFAAEGADVVAVDLCGPVTSTSYPPATRAELDAVAAEIEARGRRVVAAAVDVRDEEALRAAVAAGVERLGRLDIVVANAGIVSAGRTWETTADQWRETIDVNLTGAFHTAKATVPILLEQGTGGVLIFIGSVAGTHGLPGLAAYSASKHGVVGLAKVLANELAAHRIRVNAVLPSGVDTEMRVAELGALLDAEPHYRDYFTTPWPETISEADDIAAAVLWLAGDEARHITGIQLPVDRGRTAK